jgi:photosystem II stability/assembly factor-like uncharacterized protein
MLVSLLSCGVYRATDYPNFNSWTASVFKNRSGTTLNPSTFGRTSVAIAPNDATRAYAAVGDKAGKAYVGFFRSTDGGQTFLQTASTPMLTYNSTTYDGTNDSNSSQSGYDQSLIVSPYAKANVVFGGVLIYYSTDGGDTWAPQEQTHVDQHAFDVDPSSTSTNGAVINAGNDGGLYQFNLRTLSEIKSLNANLPTAQIYGVSAAPSLTSYALPGGIAANQVLAGFQDNGAQVNQGMAGLAWTQPPTASSDRGPALISQANASFAYTSDPSGPNPFGFPFQLDQSTNSGSTWTTEVVSNSQDASKDPGAVLFPPIATDPTTSSRVLLAANALYSSTDNGVTWSKQSSSFLTPSTCTSGICPINDLQFAPSDGTVAYAISATDGIAPFTISYSGNANLNSSATWTNITGTPPFSGISIEPTSIAVSPVNSKQAYVSFANHGLIANPIYTVTVTTNGAAATSAIWQPVAGGGLPPSTPVDKLLLDKTDPTGNTLLAGTDIGLFRSVDGGADWFQVAPIPATPVLDLSQNTSGLIIAASHGRGAWQLTTFQNVCGQVDAANLSLSNLTAIDAYFASIGLTPEREQKSSCNTNNDTVYFTDSGVALGPGPNGTAIVTSVSTDLGVFGVDGNCNLTGQIGYNNQILNGASCLDLTVGANPQFCIQCMTCIGCCDDCPVPHAVNGPAGS